MAMVLQVALAALAATSGFCEPILKEQHKVTKKNKGGGGGGGGFCLKS